MKRIDISLILLSLLLPHCLMAQGDLRWATRYAASGNGPDRAYAIALGSNDRVYATGSSLGATSLDFTTVCLDANGQTRWTARYDGPDSGDDQATALQLARDGSIYVAGYSRGANGGADAVLVKYDADGNEVWSRRYDGPIHGEDIAYCLGIDPNGHIIVACSSYGTVGYAYPDITLLAYAPNGDSLWTYRYKWIAGIETEPRAMAIDHDGNIYVAGWTHGMYDTRGTTYDILTVACSSTGAKLWSARYNGSASDADRGSGIAVDDDANVYVTGLTMGSTLDYVTLKYRRDGTLDWSDRYDGNSGDDVPYALALVGTDAVAVTGKSFGEDATFDATTILYDRNGSRRWVARHRDGKHNAAEAYAISSNASGEIAIAGATRGNDANADLLAIRYNPSGNELWSARYDGGCDLKEVGNDVGIDAAGNVYVAGIGCRDTAAIDGYLVVKYASTPLGVEDVARSTSPTIVESIEHDRFGALTMLSLRLTEESRVVVTVIDALGRELGTPVDRVVPAGLQRIRCEMSDRVDRLPVGAYLYRITVGEHTEAIKVIITR